MSFLYFCYGSNMLTKRMHINCPTAKKICLAKLKDFKFAYNGYAEQWKGATANILDSPGDSVWGIVWEISKEQEEKLDRQEVGYKSIQVNVEEETGSQISCKTFQKISSDVGLPSVIYKTVVLTGAKEHNLPSEYIQHLESFKDNGYKGKVDIPVNIEGCSDTADEFISSDTLPQPSLSTETKNRKRKRPEKDNSLEENILKSLQIATEALSDINNEKNVESVDEIFGLYVGAKLKSIPDSLEKELLKSEIIQKIIKLEYKN